MWRGALQISGLKPRAARQFRIHAGASASSIHGLQNLGTNGSERNVTFQCNHMWIICNPPAQWLSIYIVYIIYIYIYMYVFIYLFIFTKIMFTTSSSCTIPLAKARNQFNVLIQVVWGETLVSCFAELEEKCVAKVLRQAKPVGHDLCV